METKRKKRPKALRLDLNKRPGTRNAYKDHHQTKYSFLTRSEGTPSNTNL